MTMSMYELDGKVAIVTGCAREQGIGRATANRLAAEGCKVVLTDVGRRPDLNPDYVVGSLDELDEAAAEVSERGGTATAIVADVTDPASVQNLVDQSVEAFGGVDILVNVAGVGMGAPFLEMPLDVWNHVIAVNTTGPMLCAQAAAKQMVARGSGSIQLTGASASYKGYANSSSFAMGKFGLRGLAQSLARELQPKNVHVAHFCIDGGIMVSPDDPRTVKAGPDGTLAPDAIAETYLHIHRQHRSAWSWEIELRPWAETF